LPFEVFGRRVDSPRPAINARNEGVPGSSPGVGSQEARWKRQFSVPGVHMCSNRRVSEIAVCVYTGGKPVTAGPGQRPGRVTTAGSPKRYLRDELDARSVQKITTADVRRVLRSVRHLSGWTQAKVVQVMREGFGVAIREEALVRSPLERLDPREVPKPSSTKKPRRLDEAELEQLFAAAKEKTPGYYPLFVLLAFTGLRVREALALTWAEVDLDEAVIRIERQPADDDRGHLEVKTVTPSGSSRSTRACGVSSSSTSSPRRGRPTTIRSSRKGAGGRRVTGTRCVRSPRRSPGRRSRSPTTSGSRCTRCDTRTRHT
jgi:Phage integrase family